MTENQRRMAIALGACTFVPGIGTKRFALNMAEAAQREDSPELTEKQAAYLCQAVFRFRRQIEKDVVLLALAESANQAINHK